MVNLELYRVFYYVAKFESITKAAAFLFISQPAVSQSVKALESQLGVRLFVRTNKGMNLSVPEGVTMFEFVKKALELIDQGETSINLTQSSPCGKLRITASDSIFKHLLKHKVFEFMEKNPQISVSCENRTTRESVNLLKNGSVDIGIISLPYKDDDLRILTDYVKLNYIFVASRAFGHLAGKVLSLDELKAFPLIFLDSSSSATQSIENFFYSHGVEIKPQVELGSLDVVVDFTKMGKRLGLVPREYVLKELEKGELLEIKVTPAFPTRTLGIATYKKSTLSFGAKEFLEMLTK